MFQDLPALGVALLVVVSLAGVCSAWWLGVSFGRIVLCLVGVLLGGLLCAAPGAVIWMLTLAGSASGTSPAPAWPAIVFVLGGALGALAGLLAMERLCLSTRAWRPG
jgi:hypothetical protein